MDVISALHNRVSIAVLGGPGPDQAQLEVMLRAAMRAPDHGVLRPWRFLILEGQQRQWLGDVFVEARLQDQPDTDEDALTKLRSKPLRAASSSRKPPTSWSRIASSAAIWAR